MSIYNLVEYSEIYAKVLGSLWQCFRVELNDGTVTDFESFKFK